MKKARLKIMTNHQTVPEPTASQNSWEEEDTGAATIKGILAGHLDSYWHGRIQRIFADAGFVTRRLEREEAHPIWLAWLTRTTFDLSRDKKVAIKQLRKVLNQGGIKVLRDQFNIIDWRGDKLRCVFILDLGLPGVLQGNPPRFTPDEECPAPC